MPARNDRNRRTSSSRNSTRATTSRTSQAIDPARLAPAIPQSSPQPLALVADSMSTLLRTAEAWSQVQAQALQRSGQAWRQAAERLRTAAGPDDLISAQAQILIDSVLQFVQLTQDLMQVSVAAQPAAADLARDETSAAGATMDAAAKHPVMQAWQAMVNPLGIGVAGGLNAATH